MENICNFIVSNWWQIIIIIAMLPTLIWGLLLIAGPIADDGYELAYYPDFWNFIVCQQDILDYPRKTFGAKLLCNRFVVVMNFISLFFIWGYVLTLIGCLLYTIWRPIRWFFKLIFKKTY